MKLRGNYCRIRKRGKLYFSHSFCQYICTILITYQYTRFFMNDTTMKQGIMPCFNYIYIIAHKKGEMNLKKLRATCILLSAMLASSNIVWASNYKDTQGHWAESAITTWSDKNVLTGYHDDLFRPDEMITRGEMAVILDKMMDYTEMQENTFTDLKEEDFYTESILKAVKAGTFVATDDNLARDRKSVV